MSIVPDGDRPALKSKADDIRDEEIADLQRQMAELRKRIAELERRPACPNAPVWPRPYPDSPPYPWNPWTAPHRPYRKRW